MRASLFFILFLLLISQTMSQDKINQLEKAITVKDYRLADDLSRTLIQTEQDLNKAYGYWGLGVSNLSKNPDSANYFLQLALQQNPPDLLKIKILNAKGNYLDIVGLTRKSTQIFLQVVDIASSVDPPFLAGVYNNLCIGYRSLNQFDSAIYYGFLGLKIAEENDMYFELKRLYNSIAISFAVQGNLNIAATFFRKSLTQALANQDSVGASKGFINLTQLKADQEDLDSAEYFLEQAKVFNAGNRNVLDIVDLYSLLSELKISQHNPKEALTYLDQALAELGMANYPSEIISILLEKARIYLLLEDYLACKITLAKAEILILKSDGKQDLLTLRQLQKRLLIETNSLQEAIYIQFEIDSLTKRSFDDERARAIEDIRIKYETDKKEQEIIDLKQAAEISKLQNQQQLLFFVIAAIMLLSIILVVFFIFRNKALRSSQEKLIIEQKLLRSQMNPHFLFNALAAINAFIFKGNKYEASEYLNTFSELTRNILKQSSMEWITLKEELLTVRKYLEIQSLRFSNLSFNISSDINLEDVLVPPVLLQPFVENSIVHGFKNGTGGHIIINIKEEGHDIIIRIEDNGAGLQGEIKPTSKAIEITRSRIILHYGKGYADNNPSIENKLNAEQNILGVVVRLTLPFKESL